MSTFAHVRLWGTVIGAVELPDGEPTALFQYTPEFAQSGIQVAPLTMPLGVRPYRFPELARRSFAGLPGFLVDSLPDRYGHALIDAWLARQGRQPDSFNAVERLCYVGSRGMGALEFQPAQKFNRVGPESLDVAAMVALASEVLSRRGELGGNLAGEKAETLSRILQVGTSAGGARAKATIAWNPTTNEVRSGQIESGSGFEHWLLKLDGVAENRDKESADRCGFGTVEYAYSLMARAAGITMAECRLLDEGPRRHFMTRRFDRLANGQKLHMLSLAGMAHFDYNLAGAYAYEQIGLTIRTLGLPMSALEELFRRMVFNVLARNQDDHVKNTAFLMDKAGKWSLAPAYDLTYANNPAGAWTSQHQVSINGKRSGFVWDDFVACAKVLGLKRGRDRSIFSEVRDAVKNWPAFSFQAGLSGAWAAEIGIEQRKVVPNGAG